MKAPPNFTLDPNERSTPLWHKLKGYLEHRLQSLRERNDGPLSEHETATVRGQIAAINGLLKLGKGLPPFDGE